MNIKILSRSIGLVLLLLAAAMGASLLVGWLTPVGEEHNPALEVVGWIYSISITALAGGVLLYLGRKREKRQFMIRKEAIAIVGMGWVACSVFTALPFILCAPNESIDRALFEAVSGLTTTGATIFPDLDAVPKTVLLWRSVTQWLGGMGILGMFVLLLSGLGASGKTLMGAESSSHSSDLSLTNVRQTTRSLWAVYTVLTVIAGIGMLAFGMNPFQAINHAMTSTATGGFGTENDSIDSFGTGLKVWIIAIMVISGVSIPLYVVLIRKRDFGIAKRHEETWWFLGILTVACIILLINAAMEESGAPAVNVVFNTVALMTGTGYAVGDYNSWPLFAQEVLLVLMVIGGCAGSTTGGLKVSRVILWFRCMRIELTRAFRPRLVQTLKINGSSAPEGIRSQLFIVLTMAAFLFVTGTLLLQLFEPDKSLLGCASAVVSALSNVGPAFAEFGPTSNYSTLSTPSALMLPFLMVIGRLEYIAVLVLFSRKLWRHY